MAAPDLVSLRDRIEAVDRQIIGLLAERMRIVEDVIAAKLSAASPFRDRADGGMGRPKGRVQLQRGLGDALAHRVELLLTTAHRIRPSRALLLLTSHVHRKY